jgi:CheY-like chemotaxis protein
MFEISCKRNILIVEDDLFLCFLISKYLRKQGYRIETTTNGIEALDYLLSTSILPDLILSDIMMPYMNGTELLSKIKQNKRLEKIKVFAMTAMEEEIIPTKAENSFDLIFKKPFSLLELYNEIEKELP